MIVGAGWSILDNFTPDLSSCKSRDPPPTLEFSIRLVSRSFYVSNSTSAKRVWSWHCEAGEYFSGSRCPGWKGGGQRGSFYRHKGFPNLVDPHLAHDPHDFISKVGSFIVCSAFQVHQLVICRMSNFLMFNVTGSCFRSSYHRSSSNIWRQIRLFFCNSCNFCTLSGCLMGNL